MTNVLILAGRIGLSLLFILSGVAKLGPAYAGVQGYMESAGVSGSLLPVVIALEVIGGVAVLVGGMTRWAALGLAVFSVASAFLFHFDLGDQGQFTNFLKNVAVAGGFFMLGAHGAGAISVDHWIASRNARYSRGAAPA